MYKNNIFSNNNNMKDGDIKLVIKTRKEYQEKKYRLVQGFFFQ